MIFGVKLSEMRKALAPALVTIVLVLAHAVSTGEVNNLELVAAAVGFVQAFLAFWVTNVPAWAKLKAYIPLVVNLVGVLFLWAGTGTFNREELVGAGLAIVLAILTGTVDNKGRTVAGGSLPVAGPAVR